MARMDNSNTFGRISVDHCGLEFSRPSHQQDHKIPIFALDLEVTIAYRPSRTKHSPRKTPSLVLLKMYLAIDKLGEHLEELQAAEGDPTACVERVAYTGFPMASWELSTRQDLRLNSLPDCCSLVSCVVYRCVLVHYSVATGTSASR
jgi:hypothetical protein